MLTTVPVVPSMTILLLALPLPYAVAARAAANAITATAEPASSHLNLLLAMELPPTRGLLVRDPVSRPPNRQAKRILRPGSSGSRERRSARLRSRDRDEVAQRTEP